MKEGTNVRGAVLGADVSKSRSPHIHLAAWKALHRGGTYDAISVPARAFRSTVRRLASEGYDYVNVTIPHKRLAASMATRRSRAVQVTGAANTLIFRSIKNGRLKKGRLQIDADNTDGQGLLAALADLGVKVLADRQVVMVGAGGAAAGALLALCGARAHVVVLARRPATARALVRRLPVRLRAHTRTDAWSRQSLADALANADVLISAVPAAAWDADGASAGLITLPRDVAVLEMAYGATTPLARAVRPKTRRYQDGLPMLVHQAAASIEIALGKKPPVRPLFRAVGVGTD